MHSRRPLNVFLEILDPSPARLNVFGVAGFHVGRGIGLGSRQLIEGELDCLDLGADDLLMSVSRV